MDDRCAYIALNMIEGVGPVTVRSLVEALGSAAAVFEAEPGMLKGMPGVGPVVVQAILHQRDTVAWRAEIEKAENSGIRILTPLDEEYPRPLKEIHDPPLALYVRGRFETRDARAIAVVGTRKPTHYGRDMAVLIAGGLARMGYTVISGLAEGVDTCAHSEALRCAGRTLAVIGSGLEELYPPSNAGLADEIAHHGAVISEFPLARKPDKTTFPIRNRVVSGLCMGVVVVEAGVQSGALITARMALEHGRAVFAVPGRVDSPASRGTNRLIKEGARLVEDVDDILQEFEFLLPMHETRPRERKQPVRLSSEEEKIVACLADGEQCVDMLIRNSGLRAAEVSSLLVGLEMKKMVRIMPGQMVEMNRGGSHG
jgi:DNA processing protein